MSGRPKASAFLFGWAAGAGCVIASPVSLDPLIVFEDMRGAYLDGPFAERVEIRVSSDGRMGSDTLLIAADPSVPEAYLEVGEARVWATQELVRVVHVLDERAFYESREPAPTIAGSLAREFPPLPLPQLDLALGAGDVPPVGLTEYAKNIRWLSAHADEDADPPFIEVVGRGDRSEVTLRLDVATSRLDSMSINLDGGAITIDLSVERLEFGDLAPLELTLERREPVESISELRPRAGDLIEGDPLPSVKFLPIDSEMPLVEIGPSSVTLFYWEWSIAAASAYSAMQEVAGAEGGAVDHWGVLVLSPFQGEVEFRWGLASDWVAPDPGYYTVNAQRSIERFDRDARAVMVVVDGEGVIRLVETFGDATPEQLSDDPRATPDPELSAELQLRIERAVR